MSDKSVNIALKGDASGLISATKGGEKALDSLGQGAKQTGRQLDGMGKEAVQTEREVKGLGDGAREAGTEMDGMGRSADRAARSTANLGRASHGLRTAGKALALGSEKIVNQYTALAGGAGIGLALNKQIELNDQITQMGIAARDTQTGMVEGKSFASWAETTKRTVMDVSKATGQSAEELTSGMQAIIQRTGDMGLATSSLKLMGETATASGSSVAEVGALIANLGQKANIKGPEQMRQAITLLLAQGKSGAFELKDMVTNGERLFSVMSLFGPGGVGGLKSFGAFVQMARTATGSSEQASTAIERLGAFMSNVKKVEKHLASAGIHVKLDEKADMETNIKKIISATGGKFSELSLKRLSSSQAFGEEGIRAISMMANEYMAGNGFKMFDSFKEAGGDLQKNTMLMDDFATRVKDSKFQMDRLVGSLRDFADKSLSGPLAGLTSMMSFFNGNAVLTDALIRNITKSLLAMAAVAASVKLYKTFQEFRGILRPGGAGSSGALSQAVGTEVQRVYVVNMGDGLGGGVGSPAGAGPLEPYGPAKPASAWSRWGRNAAIGGGIAGVGAVMAFAESGNTPEGWGRAMGGAAGVALGAFGGPLGMIIGQQIGDYVGLFLGNTVGNIMKDVEEQRIKAKREDSMDVAGTVQRAKTKAFMGASDATGNTSQSVRNAVSAGVGARFMGYQRVGSDGAPVSLNVTTVVAKDGTAKTTVTGATEQVSVNHASKWFDDASKQLAPSSPGWAH